VASPKHSWKPSIAALLCAAVLLSACGCEDPGSPLVSHKHPDERISKSELEVLKRILSKLPQPLWSDWRNCFVGTPDWPDTRTLPVSELVDEEQRRLSDRWDAELLTARLDQSRALKLILRRERVTTEQFASLLLSVGLATSRSFVPGKFDLEAYERRGLQIVKQLKSDGRPYESLSEDEREQVLFRAVWITRLDRATRLLQPSEANVALVRSEADSLKPLLPGEFLRNPLEELADPLEEHGVPFIELPASGSDADIPWSRADALPQSTRSSAM
jgi:hypothetical protein